ncbi:MAG: hypothetical protein R3D98_00630 [Candidatus Krumholzibacteriia bacterium]
MPADFSSLAELISKHRVFSSLINSLHPGRLPADRKALVLAMSSRIKAYLAHDKGAVDAWEEFLAAIETGYVFPLRPTRRQVIAATMLAGAAVERPRLALRSGLSPTLYQARADRHGADLSINTGPGQGQTRIFVARIDKASSPALAAYRLPLADYGILGRNLTATGKLAAAIESLLTDDSKSLAPLGALRELDPEAIEKARSELLTAQPRSRAAGVSAPERRVQTAWAPRSMAIRLKDFRCVKQQENAGSDEIFWAGSFVRCMNLQRVYEAIEATLAKKEPMSFDLEFDWELSSFMIPANGGKPITCSSGGPWISLGDTPIYEQQLYRGFGPWAGSIWCIEDDDQEYEAVGEVIDTVGDYAKQVSRTASTVSAALAAGGVTGPAAAAAGAVATAGQVVSVGADVVGAIIDIVNFFDKDDMIDATELSDGGDYAMRNRGDVPVGNVDNPALDLEESNHGAHYQLRTTTNYGPAEEFPRTWSCQTTTTWFPLEKTWFTKKGGPLGAKGDMTRTVPFNPPVQFIEASDVEQDESAAGHAEVIGKPWLTDNGSVGHVKVHWGISAFRSFRFKFWVKGIRIDRLV